MSRHLFPTSSLATGGVHLRVDGLSFSYGGHRVLTDISFTVAAGERAGLIGENGSGKSTLLKAIAGILDPSAGSVTVNAAKGQRAAIGLLHQEPPFAPHDSIEQALEAAVAPARRAVHRIAELGDELSRDPANTAIADDLSAAIEYAEQVDAWDTDVRIAASLSGLGLGGIDTERPVSTLSGGQQARLALAWLLLSAPDVLLMDEPTNHLDDTATEYVVQALTAWRGPVLVASHDRAFLDESVTSLIDLDPSPIPHAVSGPLVQDGAGTGISVARFTGSYSDYLDARDAARHRWEQQFTEEQQELSRLRATVADNQSIGHGAARPRTEIRAAQKFYADRNAKVVSRRVRDSRARLADLAERQVRKPPERLRFSGLTAGGAPRQQSTGPVLSAVEVCYDGRLTPTTLTVSSGEKWLVTGRNGVGKSTLLRILAGQIAPTSGHLSRTTTDRVGLLAQEVDLPDVRDRGPERTVEQTYIDLVGEDRAEQMSLDAFGLIARRDRNRRLTDLSVGQRRRLALAVLIADPPEILLLDEPTNHFSLDLVTELEAAVRAYPGAVVVASHDRWLRRRWVGEHLAM